MNNNFFSLFFLALSFSLIFSCSSASGIKITETDAKNIYEQGIRDLEKRNFNRAEARFTKVISDYRLKNYSKYKPLSAIALGDTYYAQKDYSAASAVYNNFITENSTHEKAPWATLQLGFCYLGQGPSDLFILPNMAERDIKIVETAAAQFRYYLERYPDDESLELGRKGLEEAESILIERDLRIAEFYLKQKKYNAAYTRVLAIANKEEIHIASEKLRMRIAEILKKCLVAKNKINKKEKNR
ncbi:MAG: outer membrane protein assembly factor BamD [bacterium]